MNSENQTYYPKDFRSSLALFEWFLLIGLVLALGGFITCVYFAGSHAFHFKVSFIILLIGVGLGWLCGHLYAKYIAKWIKFPASCEATNVLYGRIENFETATKFKLLFNGDIGGIYRDEDQIILGSIDGERRCSIENFSFEIVNRALISFIKITMDKEEIAFSPQYIGSQPLRLSPADKANWGYQCIQKITRPADSTQDPYADTIPEPYC